MKQQMDEQYSWENRILREIDNKNLMRRAVAKSYRYASESGEKVDWERVHRAIVERWSYFGLEWIRREAKKLARAARSE